MKSIVSVVLKGCRHSLSRQRLVVELSHAKPIGCSRRFSHDMSRPEELQSRMTTHTDPTDLKTAKQITEELQQERDSVQKKEREHVLNASSSPHHDEVDKATNKGATPPGPDVQEKIEAGKVKVTKMKNDVKEGAQGMKEKVEDKVKEGAKDQAENAVKMGMFAKVVSFTKTFFFGKKN